MKRRNIAFTMVELLVAMGILIVIMGFLLQFVAGAQKIWTSSTRTTALFEKADVVLGVFADDMQNIITSNEPGKTIPVYRNTDTDSSLVGSKNKELFCGFISTYSTSKDDSLNTVKDVGAYPILYYFSRKENKLYRIPVDSNKLPGEVNIHPFIYYGIDYSTVSIGDVKDFFHNLIKHSSSPFNNESTRIKFPCIADNVLDCDIKFVPDTNGYSTERPLAALITLTLFEPADFPAINFSSGSDLSADDEDKVLKNSRTFSKIVFLK